MTLDDLINKHRDEIEEIMVKTINDEIAIALTKAIIKSIEQSAKTAVPHGGASQPIPRYRRNSGVSNHNIRYMISHSHKHVFGMWIPGNTV